jgi:hypothetical protein
MSVKIRQMIHESSGFGSRILLLAAYKPGQTAPRYDHDGVVCETSTALKTWASSKGVQDRRSDVALQVAASSGVFFKMGYADWIACGV